MQGARGLHDDAARAAQRALRAACAHPRGGHEPIPPVALAHGIGACFERVVVRQPSRPAVIGPGGPLTYAELDAAANRMAHALLARTGAGAEPVALLFGTGVDFVIASIAALKAGAIQVPLDCDSPRARLAFMLEHSGARLLVTAPEHAALARDLAGSRREILDTGGVHAQPASAPGLAVAPDALASIDYTSGSTGAPKGIVHSHRAALVKVMRSGSTPSASTTGSSISAATRFARTRSCRASSRGSRCRSSRRRCSWPGRSPTWRRPSWWPASTARRAAASSPGSSLERRRARDRRV